MNISSLGGSAAGATGGADFTLDSVKNTLGEGLTSTQTQMTNFLQTMDPNDMNDLMQMQMNMVQWETEVTTTSNIYKGIGDTLKSVANNVGS